MIEPIIDAFIQANPAILVFSAISAFTGLSIAHISLANGLRIKTRMIVVRLPFSDRMFLVLAKGYRRINRSRLTITQLNFEDRRVKGDKFINENLRSFNSSMPFKPYFKHFKNPRGEDYTAVKISESETSNGYTYYYEDVPLLGYNSNSKPS